MSKSDQVVYLNREPLKFDSKLRQMIEAAKVSKMPPDQWLAYIKGLASKGVKKDDIQDSGVQDWLSGEKPDSPAPGKAVEKAALLDAMERYSATVKEVVLGQPQYKGWHHGGPDTPYQEILFIANSERANVEDRLEEIEFEMESLGFDLERLAEDPSVVLRLEKERAALMTKAPSAAEFSWSHFTSNDIQGKHGKNLIAHARVTIHGDLYFIEEIQSDWGQSGRVRKSENDTRRSMGLPELSWKPHVPRGPFVTDTKLWAGLVLRRLLQRAAMMPEIKRVAWIRIAMKNGQKVNPAEWQRQRDESMRAAHEEAVARALAAGEEPPKPPVDDADHYYTRVIPSLAEAAIGKAGGKVAMTSEVICGHRYDELPGFVMTDEVRQVLKGVQPLYSAASVLRNPKFIPDERLVQLVKRGRSMVGSLAHIRFVNSLYNLEDMSAVSGRTLGRFVSVALNSTDVKLALDHECFHFAFENLMSRSQRQLLLEKFAPGSDYNLRVRDLLLRHNQPAAAAQCDNAEEAAAHGFSYWAAGKLRLDVDKPTLDIFEKVAKVVSDGISWLRSFARERKAETVEDVFMALRHGELAAAKEARSMDDVAEDPIVLDREYPRMPV